MWGRKYNNTALVWCWLTDVCLRFALAEKVIKKKEERGSITDMYGQSYVKSDTLSVTSFPISIKYFQRCQFKAYYEPLLSFGCFKWKPFFNLFHRYRTGMSRRRNKDVSTNIMRS